MQKHFKNFIETAENVPDFLGSTISVLIHRMDVEKRAKIKKLAKQGIVHKEFFLVDKGINGEYYLAILYHFLQKWYGSVMNI